MFDEFKHAFNRYNNAHVQLIIINVVIFLAISLVHVLFILTKFDAGWDFVTKIIVLPPQFVDFVTRPWTLITYAFAHDWNDIWHIFWNMITLYWFGKLFVEYLGDAKLIAVYVLGALAGGVVYLLMYNLIPFYAETAPFHIGLVGASAAIYAIMMAIVTLIPDYTFFLLFLGPVKIKYIAMFFVVVSFIGITGGNMGGNLAHLGGIAIGFIYTKQLNAGVNWGNWVTATLAWIGGLFKPSSNVKVTYRKEEPVRKTAAGQPKQPFNKASQEEIDAILDKISDKGYESLTKEEKEKLFNASKK